MSKNETTEVIQNQLHLLEIELNIELQRMKVAELNARAKTLIARESVEDFKLRQMITQRDNIKDS